MTDSTILCGDARRTLLFLPDQLAQTCVTSPPYFGLRDYGGGDAEVGREKTLEDYVANLVAVFREVRRVLRDDGTLWLNIGDSYNNFRSQMGPGQGVHGREKLNGKPSPTSRRRGNEGLKEKDLIGVPWEVAFALRADGWFLRSDVIWHKPNPMPESVTDRPTSAHEHTFLLTKSPSYFYDHEAMKEPETTGNGMRNRRNVWTIGSRPFRGAHFATMPVELAAICVKGGSRERDLVLDPFAGAGTTGVAAVQNGRKFIGVELNPDYVKMANERVIQCGVTK
jgi:DNA modification methylase